MTTVAEATPWGAMLRTATVMGVSSEAFWRLSLAEWRMLTETTRGPAPMARAELDGLMRTWPDGETR